MSFATLFLQRHDSFHTFWLAGVWEQATDQQMRARPHPRITSIAWNIWHLTRGGGRGDQPLPHRSPAGPG